MVSRGRKFIFVVVAAMVVVAICGVGLLYHLKTTGMTFSVEETQLQQQLEESFPMQKAYPGGIVLEFLAPYIALQEGSDRINYFVDAIVKIEPLGQEFRGRGQISGGLRFDAESGEFFVVDSRVDNLEIDGLPGFFAFFVQEAVERFALEYLDENAVYRLEGPIRGEGLLAMLPGIELRGVQIRDRKLWIHFGI